MEALPSGLAYRAQLFFHTLLQCCMDTLTAADKFSLPSDLLCGKSAERYLLVERIFMGVIQVEFYCSYVLCMYVRMYVCSAGKQYLLSQCLLCCHS